MVESQIINSGINPLNLVKTISKEELLLYAKEYLKNHVYISNKKLASTYIEEHNGLSYRDLISIRIRKALSSRFIHTIHLLHREGFISRYNNSHLYKRIDTIIAK